MTTFALALLLAALQESTPPAAAEGPPSREERLAKSAAQFEHALERMRAHDLFPALRERLQELRSAEPDARWVPAGDRGYVLSKTVDGELEWTSPAEGRELPRFRDHELPGHPFPVLVNFSAQVEKCGAQFLLVTIPTRFQVYPELFVPGEVGEDFAGVSPATTEFLLDLCHAGVEVLDLLPVFAAERSFDDRNELFLGGNTHWTPRGAELAAYAVAAKLADMGVEHGKEREGLHYGLWTGVRAYETRNDDPPPGFNSQNLRMTRVQSSAGSALITVDDRKSPVLVLGDSFVHFYDGAGCDFAVQLYRALGRRIDVIATGGGGVKSCRQALRRRRDDLEGKRVVVWLMPVSNFVPNAAEWKSIPIAGN